MKRYYATGLVFGNYWGGGQGAYVSTPLNGESLEDIKNQAIKGLGGSLDAGMGYESLIGARLNIREVEIITVKGKDYSRDTTKVIFVGNLTKGQKQFLTSIQGVY